jgi:DNA (cytosine-5)-methyltransferase 1
VDNLTIPYGKWRKESIKAYGNAIVPLIAVKIFEMINKIERYEQQTTL